MKEDHPLLAVGLMCTATLLFSLMAVCAKWLTGQLPVPEVVWGRYVFHLLFIIALFPHRASTLFVSGSKSLQILRSILVLLATIFAFVALRYLPLASVAALGFVGPFFVVSLAALVLHEHVSPRRWVAVAVGLIGVLVILRPGSEAMHWAAVLPLGMALCYAIYQVITRIIRGAAPPLNSLFYTALVGAVTSSIVVPFFWVHPDPKTWALMVGTGLLGGSGHLALIKAYESAKASIVAPFVYSELLWATALGWIVFAQFPDFWTFVGAGVIVATGIYVLGYESRAR
ncbi:MAG: DMT family transporter [Gammaproteobacteria bacterium]|nr:DMT family transporter [Gammaproteobacteria bacterium]